MSSMGKADGAFSAPGGVSGPYRRPAGQIRTPLTGPAPTAADPGGAVNTPPPSAAGQTYRSEVILAARPCSWRSPPSGPAAWSSRSISKDLVDRFAAEERDTTLRRMVELIKKHHKMPG